MNENQDPNDNLSLFASDVNRAEESSVLSVFKDRLASGQPVDYTPDKPTMRDPDPLGSGEPQQAAPEQLEAEDYVPGVRFVDGTYHREQELSQTPEGRHILTMARDAKSGRRRGFFDAVMDVKLSDFPFIGMVATVGGSIYDAKRASDAIDLLESGDRDAIDSPEGQKSVLALQTYMMESEQNSNGTFWGHVGDIVRAAPGFMGEFLASNAALGYARSAVARRLASSGTRHLDAVTVAGVNRGTKILSREMADELVETEVKNVAGAGVSRAVKANTVRGFSQEAKDAMVDKIATSLRPFVEQTMGGPSLEGMTALGRLAARSGSVGADDALITAVTRNLASKSLNASLAKKGASTAFGEWARGVGQAVKSEAARAAIDFGTWGTETSTMLYGSQNRWTSSLGDVFAATFLEAPIKGALMYLPKRAAQEGVSALAGGAVTDSEMNVRIAAWRDDRQDLRDKAWLIAEGQNLLEYVSENSGRAFGAAFRSVGLASGLARTAERAWVGEVGGILRKDAEKEAGGMLNRLIRKALGGSDQYAARTEADRFKAFGAYFRREGVEVPEQTLRTMARMNALPASVTDRRVVDLVGGDFGAFTKKALKAAYEDDVTKTTYRTFFAYSLADSMARNGWGPQQTINALQQMGYHGVLGEMYEERYKDVAQALLGLDDKRTHSFFENLDRALKAFWPERGWEQLMEEAVAFSVPLATRAAVLNVQRVLGGGSEVDRARAAGRNYKDLQTGMAVTEMGFRQFHETMASNRQELEREVRAAEDNLAVVREAARLAGDEASPDVQDAENRLKSAVARRDAQDDFIKRTLAANDIADTPESIARAVAANGLMRFAVLPSSVEKGTFADKMSVVYSSEQLAEKAAAQDALLADAAFLGRSFWRAQQYGLGDSDLAGWRKIAAKTIGIAGALFCMEPALAQSNSIQWASVDEGADPSFVAGLGRIYGTLYKEAKRRLQVERSTVDIDDAEIDEAIREQYEAQARDFARNNLLLHGTRLFANEEMVAKAVGHLAKKQGYDYDPADGMFHAEGRDAVSFSDFYDANKDEADALRDSIAVETLRLLTDNNTRLMAGAGNYLAYMRLRPGDANAPKVALALAAELSGFGHVISERELEQGAPIATLLDQDAEVVPAEMIDRVRGLARKADGSVDYAAVPDALAEELARAFRRPVDDPSEKGLAARKKEIVDLVLAADALLPKDTVTFVKDIDVGGSRIYDDTQRNVTFIRNPSTGLWQTTDTVRATAEGDMLPNEGGNVTWRGTEEQMIEFAKTNGLRGVYDAEGNLTGGFRPAVKLTPARVLVTSDPVLALQKLGLAQGVMEAGRDKTDAVGTYKYDRVDPALRINDATKAPVYASKAEADRVRAEELARARYFEGHKNVSDYNFGNEPHTQENENKWRALRDQYRKTWDNVLGERGYMTVIESALRRAGVSTPSTANAVNQALGLDNRRYRIPINLWTSRTGDPSVYVSVDYSKNIDPVAALAQAAVYHGVVRHLRLIAKGTALRSSITSFWEDMDRVVSDAIYDAHTPKDVRESLRALQASVTSATDAPAVGSLVQVISGLCLGQIERAASRGHNATAFDGALSYVAPRLRELGSYIGFFGVADVLLGGTGFSRLAAFREAGARQTPEATGLLSVLSTLNDRDMLAAMAKATAEFKPAGMSWGDFEREVNQYASRSFQDRPKAKPSNQTGVDTSPFGRVRSLLASNSFESDEDVARFLRQLVRAKPFDAHQAKVSRAVSEWGARRAVLENQLAAAAAEVDRLNGELRKHEGDEAAAMQLRDKYDAAVRDRGEAEKLLKEIAAVITAAEDAEARAQSAGSLLKQAGYLAGDTVEEAPANTQDARPPAATPRRRRKPRGTSYDRAEEAPREAVDFVDAETETFPVHVGLQEDIDGNLVLDVAEDRGEVDELTDKHEAQVIGINIVRHAVMVLAGHDIADTEAGRAEFMRTLERFTDGVMPTSTMETLWRTYRNGVARTESRNDDPTRTEQDVGEAEEGADSQDSYNDGAKLAAAYSNEVLDSLLSLFTFVSPETGRELQAVLNSLRDNIVNLSARIEAGELTSPKLRQVVDLMNGLFNARAVVYAGIESAPDREALFTYRLNNLLGGKANPSLDDMLRKAGGQEISIDDVVSELMAPDADGRPIGRKLAFFMSYLRSLDVGARRNLMTLACSSTACKKIGIRRNSADDGSTLTLDAAPQRFGHVSQKAASASFMKFARGSVEDAAKAAAELRAAASKATTGTRISENCRQVALALAPVLGRESPFVQMLMSPHLYDSLIRNTVRRAREAVGAAVMLDKATGEVPLVASAARILERYAEEAGALEKAGVLGEARRRRLLDSIVTVEISAGLDTTSGRAGHKTAGVNTPWSWVMNAYTAGLPETVARARVIPERNSRAASKVAISLRDISSVMSMFMDRGIDDKTGFAYHAYEVWKTNDQLDGYGEVNQSKFGGNATEAQMREYFVQHVLPACRQRMIWPDSARTEILAKNIDRDYSAEEVREACARHFVMDWASRARLTDDERKELLKQGVAEDRLVPASNWFVRVYNGDHSSGVIMQIPTSVLGTTFRYTADEALAPDGYNRIADRVYSEWLGFDAFGTDPKRSVLSCNEFPGRSMHGVRVNPDGTVEKGHSYVHVIHNYADEMDGHNDAFLGMSLCTGYGLAVQQQVAKDRDTSTHKLQVMGASGVDLTLMKSLITAMWEHSGSVRDARDAGRRARGAFPAGSAERVIMDHLIKQCKAHGGPDLNNEQFVDEDALKVGVLNSKNMYHPTGVMKNGKEVTETLVKYVFRKLGEADITGTVSGARLDEILADGEDGKFAWRDWNGDRRVTIAELVGSANPDGTRSSEGIEVSVVDGLSGKALDFTYVDDTLMSYQVANVSHKSDPHLGRMARNNAVDGLTMGAGLVRSSMASDPDSARRFMEAIAAWGVMATVTGTDSSNFEAARDNESCMRLRKYGAHRDGVEVTEQASRDNLSLVKKGLNPPFYKVSAPLLSGGAVYDDATGKVVSHTRDLFIRNRQQGSRVFSYEDAQRYLTARRLASVRINLPLSSGARYGWFVNADRIDEVYEDVVGKKASECVATHGIDIRIAKIEEILTAVRGADEAHARAKAGLDSGATTEDEYTAAKQTALGLRLRAFRLFRDHHGVQLAQSADAKEGQPLVYGTRYVASVCLDDLFISRADCSNGERRFDRSAVEFGVPDPNGKYAESIYLGGSVVGLPRTPSYNGSMWAQTCRASVPVTEVEMDDGTFRPGEDAMCMPDPQTLKILGCDHDGDKADCYLLFPDPDTGVCEFSNPADCVPTELKSATDALAKNAYEWVKDGPARRRYIEALVAQGLVDAPYDETMQDGTVVHRGYTVTNRTKAMFSNTFVRGMFDMSRALDCGVREGDAEKDFYRTPMARATRAQPFDIMSDGKNDPRWDELKAKSLEAFNFLAKSRIGSIKTASKVSTSAGIADRARGQIVSLAGMLHLAQFSGCFSGEGGMFRWGGDERDRFSKWVSFMYGVDGISNATFDDIKEQICLRLGWTPGMMDTLIADLVTSGREPPSTSDEFFRVIEEYVSDVSNHGARFWMMVSSEPSEMQDAVYGEKSTRDLHADIRARFGAKGDARVTRRTVMTTLKVAKTPGGNLDILSDQIADPVLRSFVGALRAEVNGGNYRHVGYPAGSKRPVWHFVVDRLVRDVSAKGGVNAGSGLVYWALDSIAKGGSASDAARRYLDWSNGVHLLQEARGFTRAFNYTKADPASGSSMASRERMAADFMKVLSREKPDVSRVLTGMFVANMCAYNSPCLTMQGRAGLSAIQRETALASWARTLYRRPSGSPYHDLVAKLFAEKTVPSFKTMQLEGNVQTLEYFAAALTTIPPVSVGSDLMSGNGGLQAWDTMEKIALAVQDNAALGLPSTVAFHQGVVSMFETLYLLFSTSRQSVQFPAFSYLEVLPDTRVQHPGRGRQYSSAAGHGRIVCKYRDKDMDTQETMWDAFADVMAGKADDAKRTTGNTYTPALAKSFNLTAENVRALATELGVDLSSRQGRALRETIRILEALGPDTRITPQAFFTQYLPIYATSTERTSAPSPKTRSVLNVLPGVFERLSRRQVELDSGLLGDAGMPVGSRIMDMVVATDFAFPLLARAGHDSHIAPRGSTDARGQRGLPVKVDIIQRLAELTPDAYGNVEFTGNRPVEEMAEALRGPEGTVRDNPDGTHYIGFLEGVQALRSLHEIAVSRMSGAETQEDPAKPEPAPYNAEAAETDADEDVKRMAEGFGALVPWADVVYEGGGVFTIRSRAGLKGSAAKMFSKGNRSDVVIRVRVGRDRGVRADLNSPAFATSFCAAFNHACGESRDRTFDLTPEQFLALTFEEREALVAKYTSGTGTMEDGVMNYSLPLPSWSVDAKGLAVLAGEIHLGDAKDAKKLYHEYFHSMVGMFRTLGVFSEKDVADLRKRFGGPAKGVNELFDEEAAANAFADWVAGRANPKAKESQGVFRRILDFIRELLHGIFEAPEGFGYDSADADERLFSMVLDGYAAQSASRMVERDVSTFTEVDAEQLAEGANFHERLARSVDRGTQFGRYETAHPEREAAARMEQPAAYDDPMEGYECDETDLPYHKGLLLELSRRDAFGRSLPARKDAVRQIVRQLADYRMGLADATPFDLFADNLRLSVDVVSGLSDDELRVLANDASADPMRRAQARLALRRRGAEAAPSAPVAESAPAAATEAVAEVRTDGDLRTAAEDATADPMERAKARLELKRRHEGEPAPADATPASPVAAEPSPRASAVVDEARRIIATIPDDGVTGAGTAASIPTAQHSILRAAAHLAQSRMDEDDRNILASDRFVGSVYDRARADIAAREAATGRTMSLSRAKVENAKAMAESAAARLTRLTGTDYSRPQVLNVLMHMYEDGYVTDSAFRTNRSANRAVWGVGSGNVVTHSKRYSSSADFAGALLAASGSRFGSIIDTAVRRLEALRPLAAGSQANQDTLAHVLGQLRELSAHINITDILENPRDWYYAVDAFSQNVFTGFRRGDYDDALKDFGPYTRSSDDSETAKENAARYQLSDPADPGNAFRQMVLRMAADAVYTTAAQLKFCSEMGYQPGTIHHDAFTGRVVPAHEFTTVTRFFGIGENQLMSDSPLVARWNTPTFIAANVDDWYAGSIRQAFGSQTLRDTFMEDSKRFRGNMSALMRLVNLVSMEWGLNRGEGRRLLAIQRGRATHTMDGHDFIKYTERGGETWGFSNDKGLAGALTDIAMDDNEMRTVQLQHQLATAYMNGDTGIVTGVDDLRFTPASFMKATLDPSTGKVFRSPDVLLTEADLSQAALNKRYEDLSKAVDPRSPEAREMTTLEFALWRLTRQWHPEVTGVSDVETGEAAPAGSIGLYNRFMRTALRLARETFDRYGDDLSGLRALRGISVDDAFNDIILRGLEAEGLVVATAEDDRVKDVNGMPLLTRGTMFIRGRDVERMFEASTARRKLLDAGRDGARLTARHLADEFGRVVVEFKKAARDMPWITQGDARYLNRLDTLIPVFEGTGVFMRNAVRMERDTKRQQMIRIGRHEATWMNMLSDEGARFKTFRALTDMQLRMVHDYFNTDEEGLALMEAMERGDYAEGKRKSQRTGLVVNPGTEADLRGTMFNDVVTQIYRRQLERRLSMLEGTRPADFETEDAIGRMLQAYEHSAETGIATDKGFGLNASQLYRLHGVLPANFTVGHALVTMMRGVQNSLYYRSALTSMLMTPDVNGDPLYFAKPSLHNWEAAGIPDAVWGEVARWWASRLGPSVRYDVEKTGVENARRIYDLVADARAKSGSKKDVAVGNGKVTRRYVDLARDEMENSESMEAFMCQVANADDAEAGGVNRYLTSKSLFSLDGSEALGYARHLFQSSRMPPNAVCATLHRITSWSKSMAVAFSYFFPIATKWESPTAAVGALATLGSNLSPDYVRGHADDLAKIQGMFAKISKAGVRTFGRKDSAAMAEDAALKSGASEGWLSEDFLGFQDIRRMMDTNDPFLADLVMWAESIGISMTDRLVNPMEPGKATVVKDIQAMSGVVRKVFGKRASANFDAVMDSVFLRQGEKAFTYALNATKLAVASQVALKLKHEAELQGRAFDPIRDMKGIAEYVDSEVGGVNAFRYAWAHPHMQRLLNLMWFSWQWTRTAWEAGGGGILEDILFGGHTISKQQKKATPGRWLRMYGEVILGVPLVIQLAGKLMSWAFGCDDDDDKWWTWENDSKVGATSANITPYLRVMAQFDHCVLDDALRSWRNEHRGASAAAGAAVAGVAGYRRGGLSGAVLAALPGAAAGYVAPGLVPLYHSRNAFNVNQNEQYFANVGKQGLEFLRWFDNFSGQTMSKMALFPQALMTALLGYNPSAPDIKVNRWSGFVKMFMPFSASGVSTYGPAGGIALGMSVKKGSSRKALIDRAAARLQQIAENDRSLYSLGARNREGTRATLMRRRLADIAHDARMAGVVDFDTDIVGPAGQQVVGKYTEEFFESLPPNAWSDFDVRRAEAALRKLKRIGSQLEDVMNAIEKKYAGKGHEFGGRKSDPAFERRIRRITETLYNHAGGITGRELENQFRERRRKEY